MAVQFKKHKCAYMPSKLPTHIEIEAVSIDKKCTDWELIVKHGDTHARNEFRMFIDYCPYCGKNLSEE